ncbi:putative phosphatidylglycerol/phosphatidylinositol transfer protein DDB_G0278295 [Watersipora subatra]|uniref:putative phosphatidylglycerol/phosphatidylinositol transfer protein DDB_G0278295 n=1 Tax=Watersipora subatra TaxID=2589382 RepID=UPI00355BA234
MPSAARVLKNSCRLMMGKKLKVFGCVALIGLGSLFSTYVTFIRHPPAEEILKNQGIQVDSRSYELDPNKEHTIMEISRAAWEKWLAQNKYVPIGTVFDGACDESDKITIGKIVVMLDPETDGIKVKMYANTSFDETIYYGNVQFFVDYNGQEFFANTLDLCSADEELKCPISKGLFLLKREWKISSLLPKGEYKAKAWLSNHKKVVELCVLATLKL